MCIRYMIVVTRWPFYLHRELRIQARAKHTQHARSCLSKTAAKKSLAAQEYQYDALHAAHYSFL